MSTQSFFLKSCLTHQGLTLILEEQSNQENHLVIFKWLGANPDMTTVKDYQITHGNLHNTCSKSCGLPYGS